MVAAGLGWPIVPRISPTYDAAQPIGWMAHVSRETTEEDR